MIFSVLMKEVKSMFNNWVNDKTLDDYYCGNKEVLQKEFISCIQAQIGSDFVVMTKEELHKHRMDWYKSMEGIDDYDS